MEMEDFFLMQKGFFAMRKADDVRFGKVAFYIAAIHQNIAGKPLFGAKFLAEWLGEKPKEPTKEERDERGRKIKAQLDLMQKIQDEKDKLKNARTVKNNN